ncbi:MAG TPA: helix-turn-helix domain-containing protein [Nocardioidaceae bacterium]|nr:helix-turn-helix domain-containing protein [Nocardioidaceae bacterium]
MQFRSVVIVVFEQVQGLDVFGPADVFYFANYVAQQAGEKEPAYAVELAASSPGPVATASGPAIHATRTLSDPSLRPDVLLVAGGLKVLDAVADARLVEDLEALVVRSGEVGSICTGAALLAEAGVLDGRRATTHWALADQLAQCHPEVEVDAERIYIQDGIWTSAGVCAGIDLALELVRTHHGAAMAADVARHMVVYLQRGGGQHQLSTHLAAQRSNHRSIADLMALIADNPEVDLSVPALAAQVNMSERSFHRLFTAEVGISPGRYVERARVDAARSLLEHTSENVATIARRCGFRTPETFMRSFKRAVGVSPTEFRSRVARSHR